MVWKATKASLHGQNLAVLGLEGTVAVPSCLPEIIISQDELTIAKIFQDPHIDLRIIGPSLLWTVFPDLPFPCVCLSAILSLPHWGIAGFSNKIPRLCFFLPVSSCLCWSLPGSDTLCRASFLRSQLRRNHPLWMHLHPPWEGAQHGHVQLDRLVLKASLLLNATKQ